MAQPVDSRSHRNVPSATAAAPQNLLTWRGCEDVDPRTSSLSAPGQGVAVLSLLSIPGCCHWRSGPGVRGRCYQRCCQPMELVDRHWRDSVSTTTAEPYRSDSSCSADSVK